MACVAGPPSPPKPAWPFPAKVVIVWAQDTADARTVQAATPDSFVMLAPPLKTIKAQQLCSVLAFHLGVADSTRKIA
jgi:hypothetical protein